MDQHKFDSLANSVRDTKEQVKRLGIMTLIIAFMIIFIGLLNSSIGESIANGINARALEVNPEGYDEEMSGYRFHMWFTNSGAGFPEWELGFDGSPSAAWLFRDAVICVFLSGIICSLLMLYWFEGLYAPVLVMFGCLVFFGAMAGNVILFLIFLLCILVAGGFFIYFGGGELIKWLRTKPWKRMFPRTKD